MIPYMPRSASGFTRLEDSVLNAICEMYPADTDALSAQLLTTTVRSRENSGAGFFTTFDVERDSSVAIEGERLRNGPAAKIDGLQHGMGFILWLKEGYAECLEGYAYAESTIEIDLEQIVFELERNK
jgi:hypothetical protein